MRVWRLAHVERVIVTGAPEAAGLQILLNRPLGISAAEIVPGDDGLAQVRADTIASCDRCGWEGCPTFLRGDPLLECPRCQAAPEVDELGAGIDGKLCPPTRAPRLRARKQMLGRSGAAWRARGVGGQRVVSDPPRNAPCPCGSGKKWKKCCGR
jgi:hypothetical protein